MERKARPFGARKIDRRRVIKIGLAAVASTLVPVVANAGRWSGDPDGLRPRGAAAREVAFYNLHTAESLRTVYWKDGNYLPQAFQAIDHFFRDFRANQTKAIDPHLLDILFLLKTALATASPFNLISGYRSPVTNAWLAARSEGVSHHSMHMEGRAADVSVPGIELIDLRKAAMTLNAGGVGYYPASNFVHVDTGRIRYW